MSNTSQLALLGGEKVVTKRGSMMRAPGIAPRAYETAKIASISQGFPQT